MCVCVETVMGRIVRREEEARTDVAKGRKEERKKEEGSIIEAKRSRIVEKERNRTKENI